jgi:hypothetical protein
MERNGSIVPVRLSAMPITGILVADAYESGASSAAGGAPGVRALVE